MEFESLLNTVGARGSDSIPSATFMTADVGKPYLPLARSLGRRP